MEELCDEHVKEYNHCRENAARLTTYVDNFKAWGTDSTVGSVISISYIKYSNSVILDERRFVAKN